MDSELYEKLVEIQHEIWAHWMDYMFTCGRFNGDGTWTVPADKVSRWRQQIIMPYHQFPEETKQSDREQVDKFWPLIEAQAERIEGLEREYNYCCIDRLKLEKVKDAAEKLLGDIDYTECADNWGDLARAIQALQESE